MSRHFHFLFIFSLFTIFLTLPVLFGQSVTINGRVQTSQGQPVAMANISLPHTTIGTVTDAQGNFTLSIPDSITQLTISHVRYKTQSVKLGLFTDSQSTLLITLQENVIQFGDITVRGTIVNDERIPITHATISKLDIAEKLPQRDIPQIIAAQPGVYVTSAGGLGMNDSQIRIRGFDEKRLQVLINNIPVNDPETKNVAWVDWSGLTENTRMIQVQRGVGGSLYGSGALGGVINIVTDDPPAIKKFGGSLNVGSFGTQKFGLHLASGWLPRKVALETRVQYLRSEGWRMSNAQGRTGILFLGRVATQ